MYIISFNIVVNVENLEMHCRLKKFCDIMFLENKGNVLFEIKFKT